MSTFCLGERSEAYCNAGLEFGLTEFFPVPVPDHDFVMF